MPISLILIAAFLALLLYPVQQYLERKKFEKDIERISQGKKPKPEFSIDPDVILRVLFIAFIMLVFVILVGFIISLG